MQETVICRSCLEPIFNFLCVDCIAHNINRWLSVNKPELRKDFKSFHISLLKTFSTEQNREPCIRCRETKDSVMCPYCYAKEVFWWLFDMDRNLARSFASTFNFNFLGTSFSPLIRTRNWTPVVICDKNLGHDLNLCENCEQEGDLKETEGRWLCESCREL